MEDKITLNVIEETAVDRKRIECVTFAGDTRSANPVVRENKKFKMSEILAFSVVNSIRKKPLT